MIARLLPAVLFVAPFALGCEVQRAPNNPPPPPPPSEAAPAATNAVPTFNNACAPIGLWKVAGPGGDQEIRVKATPAKPGQFDVSYKGATTAGGAATQTDNGFNVDLGQATGGLYTCTMGADCTTMNCGFTGQTPTVFTKSGE